MTLSNRVENESNQNGGKLKAALALSTLWDNRQPSQKDHGSMFAGSSAASKKNEKSLGGHINHTDTVGGTETGLEILVMEHGMKRRKSIHEEVKGLEKRDLDFIVNLS